jgi:hypothetical protein
MEAHFVVLARFRPSHGQADLTDFVMTRPGPCVGPMREPIAGPDRDSRYHSIKDFTPSSIGMVGLNPTPSLRPLQSAHVSKTSMGRITNNSRSARLLVPFSMMSIKSRDSTRLAVAEIVEAPWRAVGRRIGHGVLS